MCLNMISSLEDRPVKDSVRPENETDYVERKVACSMNSSGLYETKNLCLYSSKMLRESLAQAPDGTSPEFSLNWKTQGIGLSGKFLTQRHFFHSGENVCSLSDILQNPEDVDEKYFLSEKAVKHLIKKSPQSIVSMLTITKEQHSNQEL